MAKPERDRPSDLLILPPSFTAAQKASAKRQFDTLQSILLNPRSRPEAKTSAQKGMAELRKALSAGNSAATVNRIPPAARSAAVLRMEKNAPGATIPSGMSFAPAALPVPLVRSSRSPAAPAVPVPPPTQPPRGSAADFVPPQQAERLPDSGIIPSLPAAGPSAPAAPPESPEMQRLRQLINEPPADAPSGELTTGQKIAYGLLAGLKGLESVQPAIEGQRAAAAQKYVAQQNQRETLINNLMQYVQLQEAQAERARVAGARDQAATDKAQERYDLIAGRVATIQGAAQAAATAGNAAAAMREALLSNPDPSFQARALDLQQQMTAINAQGDSLAELARTQPGAFAATDDPITQYQGSIDRLKDSILRTVVALESQTKETVLPEWREKGIAQVRGIQTQIDSALRQVTEGVGGWWQVYIRSRKSWFDSNETNLVSRAVAALTPETTRKLGELQGTLAGVEQIVRLFGPGANIGSAGLTSESRIYTGLLLTADDPLLQGKLIGVRAWMGAMEKYFAGDETAKQAADEIMLDMEDADGP